MVREFKFRAWDKTGAKGMIYFDLRNVPDYITNLLYKGGSFEPWFEVMQFTGLRDKNRREIYEGDVLTADGEFIDGIVRWMEDRGCYYLTDPEGYATDSDHCYDGMEWHHLEIIGNVHENPDLLKEAAKRHARRSCD